MTVVPFRGAADRPPHEPAGSELRRALARCRHAFLGVALMSGMLSLLYLTGSFFMLEIYDRVLPSRSVPTLVGLVVIAAVLYFFQGVDRRCSRARAVAHRRLARRGVPHARVRRPHAPAAQGADLRATGCKPVRDLDQVRQFLSSLGPTALFDLPWMPLYIAICFLFHPVIGATAVAGALLLVAITALAEWRSRAPTKAASERAAARNALALASQRNAEVVQAMGMGRRLGERWSEASERFIDAQQRSSDVAGGLGAISKVLRIGLQSAVLGVGAYLVIEQQATAGIIIASSILTARAVAPVELAIAHWRGFVAARQSWKRLRELFAAFPAQRPPLALPEPKASLSVEGVSAAPPSGQHLVVHDVSLLAEGRQRARRDRPERLGEIVARRGSSSASGRRCAARCASTGRRSVSGTPEALGQHIGYLPQDVELFAGTVAENIARFEPEPDAERGARGRPGRQRPRAHPAPAAGLRDPGRRSPDMRFRRGSASASRLPARSIAIRSWSCSTSRTRISTPRASRR